TLQIPEVDNALVGAKDEPAAITGERQTVDRVDLAGIAGQQLSRAGATKVDAAAEIAGGDELAIRREGGGPDRGVPMTESVTFLARLHVPDANRFVVAGRD